MGLLLFVFRLRPESVLQAPFLLYIACLEQNIFFTFIVNFGRQKQYYKKIYPYAVGRVLQGVCAVKSGVLRVVDNVTYGSKLKLSSWKSSWVGVFFFAL